MHLGGHARALVLQVQQKLWELLSVRGRNIKCYLQCPTSQRSCATSEDSPRAVANEISFAMQSVLSDCKCQQQCIFHNSAMRRRFCPSMSYIRVRQVRQCKHALQHRRAFIITLCSTTVRSRLWSTTDSMGPLLKSDTPW